MYRLFIGNKNYSSWSLRPWLLMKQLRIPFDEKLEVFEDGGSREKFRAFSPSGTVPCLHDGEVVVWDSLGIAEYLAERHPEVWPAEREARAWARCATAEMHSGFSALRNDCPMNCGIRMTLNEISDALNRDIERVDELWSTGLKRFGGPFLAGDQFCTIDAFFAPVAFRVMTYGLKLSDEAIEYGERLRALPAMQAWYADALIEPWRETDHEAEMLQAGTVDEDFRTG